MSTITKEWLESQISAIKAVGITDSNTLQAFEIALASLEAEPAIHRWRRVTFEPYGPYPWHYGNFIGFSKPVDGIEDEYYYAAPPAPVSVPEPIKRNDADGWWVYKGRRVGGGCAEWYNRALDDCRAAMLQGVENAETPTTMQTAPALDSSPKIAESPTGINQGKSEPVTTANKLPFEQWLSQQTGTIDVECGYVMTEVFFHWLRVAYEAGNSPVIPDGWVMVPEEPTHEMLEAGDEQFGTYDVYRRMIAASPQQEA
ncbi:hypothetical protein JGT77_24380 [Enterobacter hormaechei]|uniref:hypothetical protein n=1 Tax=Enterobacter hormaechei TaxID=158836 RepID=UPI0012550CCA|nr:hypothetical protein [Enterobacter hormaechei]MBJ6477448.1 hypothetical protein [Enterobacter hormaechei]MBJ6550703.1 hypothetical protein [Enterobacter hormaechei]MBJ6555426.1 hypothetical protein [Enterobacter hormaechei]VAK94482.1 Uncharacterised protein [Enterobacter hormaechei]